MARRREFEEARGERDPEVVAWLLIGGRDAVQQALDRLAEASRCMVEAEGAKRRSGAYNMHPFPGKQLDGFFSYNGDSSIALLQSDMKEL
ncbi:hypothetical protein E2562_029511 [Oryza meyeriana var. granulata]|uniref:Uncharacterized protein n=1 Tax=Oryza meyeriana var. granulata TaxID=110450 RepID=A0A6G1FDN8_9ORYZ|nr:hypothetical protein E2562_029511 [Oryza meyeriana var. granulata]